MRCSGGWTECTAKKVIENLRKGVDRVNLLCYTYIIKREESKAMRKIKVVKCAKWRYVRVFEADGETLVTQASFSTRKVANEVRDHWIRDRFFGDAEVA